MGTEDEGWGWDGVRRMQQLTPPQLQWEQTNLAVAPLPCKTEAESGTPAGGRTSTMLNNMASRRDTVKRRRRSYLPLFFFSSFFCAFFCSLANLASFLW